MGSWAWIFIEDLFNSAKILKGTLMMKFQYFLPIEFSQKGTKLFGNAMFIRFNHIISTFVEEKSKRTCFFAFANHNVLWKVYITISDANFTSLTFLNFLFNSNSNLSLWRKVMGLLDFIITKYLYHKIVYLYNELYNRSHVILDVGKSIIWQKSKRVHSSY